MHGASLVHLGQAGEDKLGELGFGMLFELFDEELFDFFQAVGGGSFGEDGEGGAGVGRADEGPGAILKGHTNAV